MSVVGISDPAARQAAAALAAGDVAGAEALCRRTLAADPGNVDALRVLSGALCRAGRQLEAVDLLRRAAAARPLPNILGELGVALRAAGRTAEAVEVFRRLTAAAPRAAAGYLHLGRCLLDAFDPEGALAALEEAGRLAPDSPDVWMATGLAHLNRGGARAAARFFERVLGARPADAEAHANLGTCRLYDNDTPGALASFRRALALRPGDPVASAGLVEALETAGDVEGAAGAVREAMSRGPCGASVVAAHARMCRREKRPADGARALEAALARPGLPAHERAVLHFAMGSSLESMGEFDRAFEQFRLGNGAYPRLYRRDAADRFLEDMKRVFPASRSAGSGEASELPVFIVGMPRSGTSLVEQVIASHPMAHGAGELGDIPQIARGLGARLGAVQPYPLCMPALTPALSAAIAREHLSSLADRAPGRSRVTDKMPHNFLHLGLISMLFPRARIIHCVRGPLDTCVSCYATQLSPAHAYSNDLADLAHAYGLYRRAMEYWKGAIGVPVLDVEYERLVADQEGESRRVVAFVGLPWDERCLRFHETGRAVATASRDQVRRPIYDSSIGRWKPYERHLGPLIEGLREYL